MTDSTAAELQQPLIHVLTSGVTADEVAAVTAVIGAAVEEELDELHDQVDIDPSAWERSQRALRAPLHPGPGAWRGFSG
ncbi:acyl-CoA carboxylase subunit epsilon [Herbiconiux sp. A18JL235]|uniref:Acyl-CoA carboxylase subunit epsilon n=1 Tax=Herbiconiux sp. A18JL235 TaxID=3152363 RepID=A0AB39BJZ7_9MICO